MTRSSTAVVLSGGAARGAWEAGVLIYTLRNVAPQFGLLTPFDVISGTSVGAFHAALLATFAGDPTAAASMTEKAWGHMALDQMVRVDGRGVAALMRGLAGRPAEAPAAVLETTPFAKLLDAGANFRHIEEHLRAGRLGAVTVTATHVASGQTTVFTARGDGTAPDFKDPAMVAAPVRLNPSHVLASAAIPVLFPGVVIGSELYCDGGVRQLVPLRPALRLGARGLLVLSSRAAMKAPSPVAAAAREKAFSSPVYLLGKLLDAFLLDHVDGDVQRLEQVNRIIAAGRRRYGPGFEAEIARAVAPEGHEFHEIDVSVLRPSEDLGRMAADVVRAPAFRSRMACGAGRLLRALAEAEGSLETDLVSYLLFDGVYTSALVDLGMEDAKAHHDEICAIFAASERHDVAA